MESDLNKNSCEIVNENSNNKTQVLVTAAEQEPKSGNLYFIFACDCLVPFF